MEVDKLDERTKKLLNEPSKKETKLPGSDIGTKLATKAIMG